MPSKSQREKYRAEGRCLGCGSPYLTTTVRCEDCRVKRQAAWLKRYHNGAKERLGYPRTKRYRDANPNCRKGEWKKQRDKDPFLYRLKSQVDTANRRSGKKGIPGTITDSQVLELYKRQEYKCYDCGAVTALSIGHGVPIFFRFSSNEITNIILQCHSCNSRQHNAIHPDFEAGYWAKVKESL